MNTEVKRIKTGDLFFDYQNPRLIEFSLNGKTTDDYILNILWEQMNVDEIVQSIISNGFFPNEVLLVVKENGRYIVIEGNRRLAAVKAILNPTKVRGMVKYQDKIDEGIKKSLMTLPVIEYDSRQAAWGFIGFKHVNGPAKWGSYSKAQYIATVHNDFRISIDEISQQIGDNNQTVLKLYQGLMVIQQAERDTDFKRDDIDAKRLYFSHLYTGLQSQGFRRYLGLQSTPLDTPNPIPADKVKNLERVMFWLYGSKRKDITPVITSQNPDLGYLSSILNDENATMTLESTGDLDAAYEDSLGALNVFQNSVIEAKSNVQKALMNVSGYDGGEALLKTVGTLSALVDSLYNAMEKRREKISGKKEYLTEEDD